MDAWGRSFAAFHLSVCESVWPDIMFVNEGECLSSWAFHLTSPSLDKTGSVFCFVLFVSVVPNSEAFSELVLAVKNDDPDSLDGLLFHSFVEFSTSCHQETPLLIYCCNCWCTCVHVFPLRSESI